jgi:signal peptidase I
MADQDPAISISPQITPTTSDSGSWKMLLAGFLSASLPGAGHLLLRRFGKAITLFGLFLALFFNYWPLRMPSHFAGTVVLVFGLVALCIFSAIDACYGNGRHSGRPSQWWLAILLPLAFVAAAAHSNWELRVAGFEVFEVPSRSMENTIPINSHVMVDRWYFEKNAPARNDLVVYINRDGIYLLKRAIALNGETIHSSDGKIFIGDQQISEPYAVHSGYAEPEMNNFGPTKVPAGKLFVMGDNRNISLDSRSIGSIDVTDLRGRPLYILAGFGGNAYKDLR